MWIKVSLRYFPYIPSHSLFFNVPFQFLYSAWDMSCRRKNGWSVALLFPIDFCLCKQGICLEGVVPIRLLLLDTVCNRAVRRTLSIWSVPGSFVRCGHTYNTLHILVCRHFTYLGMRSTLSKVVSSLWVVWIWLVWPPQCGFLFLVSQRR